MAGFDDREKGFEGKFKHDQDQAFRLTARRNKLLGLWVAERLGIPAGEKADEYAKTVVAADFEKPGDDDVVQKVRQDLAQKGIDLTEAEIRIQMKRAEEEARKQLSTH